MQDTAGREIYEQRCAGGRAERDGDGRRAIGMDRIREQGGWLMEDDDAVAADDATANEPQDMQMGFEDEDL